MAYASAGWIRWRRVGHSEGEATQVHAYPAVKGGVAEGVLENLGGDHDASKPGHLRSGDLGHGRLVSERDACLGVCLPNEVINATANQIGPPWEACKVLLAERFAVEQFKDPRWCDSRQLDIDVELIVG